MNDHEEVFNPNNPEDVKLALLSKIIEKKLFHCQLKDKQVKDL